MRGGEEFFFLFIFRIDRRVFLQSKAGDNELNALDQRGTQMGKD